VNRKGGPKFRYALELLTTPPLFEASTEQDRPRLEPGGGCVVKVTVNRRDYKGPVMFRAEGIEGVQVDPATLAENQESLELRLQLPPSFSGWGDLQLIGVTPGDSRPIQVSTRPALRKQFPGVLFPLPFLDGRITLHAAPASTVGRGD
jgi:hypothetical protein